MEDAGQNKQQKEKGEGVQFHSKNIDRSSNSDEKFFVRKKEPNKFVKSLNSFFSNKKLLIIIGSVALALIIGGIITAIVISNSADDAPSEGSGPTVWDEELTGIVGETSTILESGSNDALAKAIAYIDEKINSEQDSDKKFDLQITKASMLNNNEAPEEAISYLDSLDQADLPDQKLYQIYLMYDYAYRLLSDDEMQLHYQSMINELPKNVTSIGG